MNLLASSGLGKHHPSEGTVLVSLMLRLKIVPVMTLFVYFVDQSEKEKEV
jgi:hypothetical protein